MLNGEILFLLGNDFVGEEIRDLVLVAEQTLLYSERAGDRGEALGERVETMALVRRVGREVRFCDAFAVAQHDQRVQTELVTVSQKYADGIGAHADRFRGVKRKI